MWKIFLAFVVFAALALYVLNKGGNIDMSGEKHGAETTHETPAEPAPPATTPAAPMPTPALPAAAR